MHFLDDLVNKKALTAEVKKGFEDGQDLLEQIKLEIDGVLKQIFIYGNNIQIISFQSIEKKPSQESNLKAFSHELELLKEEFNLAKNKKSSAAIKFDDDESEDELDIGSEQKRKLLDNSTILEKTGRNLAHGYRIVLGKLSFYPFW